MNERVRPPAQLEKNVLDRIAGPNATDKIFSTKAKGVLFAGVLGFSLGKSHRKPIDAYGEGIRVEYFEEDVKIIDMIAIADSEDLNIIADAKYRDAVQIFEEYVHGGLVRIQEVCFSGERPPIEGLMMLLDRTSDSDDESLPGLI